MTLNPSSSRGMARGFSILYYSTCLLLLLFLITPFTFALAAITKSSSFYLCFNLQVLVLIYSVLYGYPAAVMTGHMVCYLNTPAVDSVKKLAALGILLDVAVLLLVLSNMFVEFPTVEKMQQGSPLGLANAWYQDGASALSFWLWRPPEKAFAWIHALSTLMYWLSHAFFLVYCSWLARHFQRNRLGRMSLIVLFVGSPVVFIFLAPDLLALTNHDFSRLLLLAPALVSRCVLFVVICYYIVLLTKIQQMLRVEIEHD